MDWTQYLSSFSGGTGKSAGAATGPSSSASSGPIIFGGSGGGVSLNSPWLIIGALGVALVAVVLILKK